MNDPLTVFHELGDVTRLRVLAAIVEGRKNVSAIVAELELSQPQVSYHLKRLKDAGLAVEEKDGRWVWYEANRDAPESHIREIIEYVKRWSPEEAVPAESGAGRQSRRPRGAGAMRKGRRGAGTVVRREGGARDDRPDVRRPVKSDDEIEDVLL